MRRRTVGIAAALLLLSPISTGAAWADPSIPSIVGGGDATETYSYMTYVSGGCGGILIRANWVLTAAHCAEGLRLCDVHAEQHRAGLVQRWIQQVQHVVQYRRARFGRAGDLDLRQQRVRDSQAMWTFSGLSTTRMMRIEAYIPNNHADATRARYRITGDTTTEHFVNQNIIANAWTMVGYACASGNGNLTVTVDDGGGDSYPLRIAADAVRYVYVGDQCR